MKKFCVLGIFIIIMAFSITVPLHAAPDFILSFNLAIPPIHNRWNMALKPWAEEIMKRSEGRILIEPYFAQALSKQEEVAESVRSGVADIGEATFTVRGLGRFPFHEQLINLTKPSNCTRDAASLVKELHNAFPKEAMGDVAGTKLLFLEGHSVGMLIGSSKKPVKTLEDLKGLKLGVSGGGIRLERAKKLGATVVGITVPDMYMSIEKGIIDGAVVDCELLVSRKLGDVIKHLTLINMGGSVFYCVMNQDTFDRMPPDLQKIIDDVSREVAPKLFYNFWERMQYVSLEKWEKEMGGKLYMLSDADYAKADELVEPTFTEWVKFSKTKGLPAEAILKKYRELESRFMEPWAKSKAAQFVTGG